MVADLSLPEWTNLLVLVQLLFALPASNGKIERFFSKLNVIKTEKRAALNNNTINDLIAIKTSKCELKDFSPESPIKFWWEAKQEDLTSVTGNSMPLTRNQLLIVVVVVHLAVVLSLAC